MKHRIIATIAITLMAHTSAASMTNETVMLLHGLARSGRSMLLMDFTLEKAGYNVIRLNYPSTEHTVQELTDRYLAPAIEKCRATQPDHIHFVAHSLGNIMLRYYCSRHTLPNIGRIVMLGPPNKGSEVVDTIGHLTLFDWFNGPAGQQLGTGTNALPQNLPIPTADIGVIAGTRSINWILSTYIPGPDDGKVSPANTKIDGMQDFATVPATHTFMMWNPAVIDMTLNFLKYGTFDTPENQTQD